MRVTTILALVGAVAAVVVARLAGGVLHDRLVAGAWRFDEQDDHRAQELD